MDELEAMSSLVSNVETTVETTQQESDSDNYNLTLDDSQTTNFRNSLSLLQNICNDCDIFEGKVRCRINNRKNIICMDLSSVLGNKNLVFSNLKNKLVVLNTFDFATGSSSKTLTIKSNQSNFEFSDEISTLTIRRPIAQYLENTYIPDDEFSDIVNGNIESNVLFVKEITGIEKKRIARLCEAFGSDTVTFEFNGSTGTFYTQTSSKDNTSESKNVVTLENGYQLTGKKTLINNLCFTLDTGSELVIKCYKVGEDYCLFKCDLKYNNDISITIYTKTRIVDSSEEE